jgi:hypothetical protein
LDEPAEVIEICSLNLIFRSFWLLSLQSGSLQKNQHRHNHREAPAAVRGATAKNLLVPCPATGTHDGYRYQLPSPRDLCVCASLNSDYRVGVAPKLRVTRLQQVLSGYG